MAVVEPTSNYLKKLMRRTAIIGSERHDSRRVDRRWGRAGRQGIRFFSILCFLGGPINEALVLKRISKVMIILGMKGGYPTFNMITKSIERAQRKVEENNFGTRKRLMNTMTP